MRAFIAIEFDEAIRRQLARAQNHLKADFPLLKWVRADQIHLTLKFLGEINDRLVVQVSETLAAFANKCSSFEVRVAGLGVLPPGGSVRVLWAGMHDAEGVLARCQSLCEEFISPLGFAAETRPFKPHLTLARVKEAASAQGLRERIGSLPAAEFGVQSIDHVTFYQSELGPRGSTYHALGRHDFGS